MSASVSRNDVEKQKLRLNAGSISVFYKPEFLWRVCLLITGLAPKSLSAVQHIYAMPGMRVASRKRSWSAIVPALLQGRRFHGQPTDTIMGAYFISSILYTSQTKTPTARVRL